MPSCLVVYPRKGYPIYMGWSEDLRDRIQGTIKLIEPNLQVGKDFIDGLLADVQKEADIGRERVSEAKLDLEEVIQQVGSRARLTGDRIEEIIRQEVQRQIDIYLKKQRAHLAKTFLSFTGQIQKSVSDISKALLGGAPDKSAISPHEMSGDAVLELPKPELTAKKTNSKPQIAKKKSTSPSGKKNPDTKS